MNESRSYVNTRLQQFGTTIFSEMSALAAATNSINLGQGFPDEDGPDAIKAAAIAAILAGHNQYPPGIGIKELRSAIVEHQRSYYGLEFDPDEEVLVTAGATEAIAASILSLCEDDDEVVLFEPYYDSYPACVAMTGAKHRVVSLHPPDWTFDEAELDRALTSRTKVLLLNSPHNPTGKVFSRAELEAIAARCIEHDIVAVTDEVYEHLIYDGTHIPLSSLPGMRDRTVTISSAAKTFSFTGWKIGWVCASRPLVDAVRTAKQFLTYVNGAPFQYAIADGLRNCGNFIDDLAAQLRIKRDRLSSGLESLGLTVYRPRATYFVTTDISSIGETDGLAFCRGLARRCGVVAVPSSVFYDNKAFGKTHVRWTFCKRLDVLDDAIARLSALSSGGPGSDHDG